MLIVKHLMTLYPIIINKKTDPNYDVGYIRLFIYG